MKRYVLLPNLEKTHVKEGYKNVCEDCDNWGEACESCNVLVPIVIEEYFIQEVTLDTMTLCGIPVGYPYEVGERRIVGTMSQDGTITKT